MKSSPWLQEAESGVGVLVEKRPAGVEFLGGRYFFSGWFPICGPM
jgi:hypothetical protein